MVKMFCFNFERIQASEQAYKSLFELNLSLERKLNFKQVKLVLRAILGTKNNDFYLIFF